MGSAHVDGRKSRLPEWAIMAMQGVVFWVGHRQSLYRHYHLPEAALTSELCNLIHANLQDNLVLDCEEQYVDILEKISSKDKKGLKGKLKNELKDKRVDLVVSEKSTDKDRPNDPKFIIEVKRAAASKSEIDKDLYRLCRVKEFAKSEIRAFLFVISEAKLPEDFVRDEGVSQKGEIEIRNSSKEKALGYCKVVRTLKASHTFKRTGKANYACIVEVFSY